MDNKDIKTAGNEKDSFLARINNQINQLNLTQKELASKLEMSESMFSKILSGQRRIDIEKLRILSNLLNLDYKELLELGTISKAISITPQSQYTTNITKAVTAFSNRLDELLYNIDDDGYEICSHDELNDSLNETIDFESVSLKDLKKAYMENKKLLELLNKLKDHRNSLMYSLKGKVNDEFIEKISKYIDVEIEINKKVSP